MASTVDRFTTMLEEGKLPFVMDVGAVELDEEYANVYPIWVQRMVNKGMMPTKALLKAICTIDVAATYLRESPTRYVVDNVIDRVFQILVPFFVTRNAASPEFRKLAQEWHVQIPPSLLQVSQQSLFPTPTAPAPSAAPPSTSSSDALRTVPAFELRGGGGGSSSDDTISEGEAEEKHKRKHKSSRAKSPPAARVPARAGAGAAPPPLSQPPSSAAVPVKPSQPLPAGSAKPLQPLPAAVAKPSQPSPSPRVHPPLRPCDLGLVRERSFVRLRPCEPPILPTPGLPVGLGGCSFVSLPLPPFSGVCDMRARYLLPLRAFFSSYLDLILGM